MTEYIDTHILDFLKRIRIPGISDRVEENQLKSQLETELELVQNIGVNKGLQVSYGIDTGLDEGYAIWLNQSRSTVLFCLFFKEYPLLVREGKLIDVVKKYFAEKGVIAENHL